MNTSELIKAIENLSQLYIDQMTPKQIAYIDGNNRALRDAIDLINEALKGKVIVPVNPTEEMIEAAWEAHVEWGSNEDPTELQVIHYRAMLDTINNEGEGINE